jgi:hypothetical protein
MIAKRRMQMTSQELRSFHSKGTRLPGYGVDRRMQAMQSSIMRLDEAHQRREVIVRAIPIKKLCGGRTAQ